jgi:hypothetical protein
MAALPMIGAKPGNLTVAPMAKKVAAASASKASKAPKYLLARADSDSSFRTDTGKYLRRATGAVGFAAFVKRR